MGRHLFEHSYDRNTLAGTVIRFVDGCEGIIAGGRERFATIRSFGSHGHAYEMAWDTVAWSYVDKGRAFPTQ